MNCTTKRSPIRNQRQVPTFTNIINELFQAPVVQRMERDTTYSRPAVNINKSDDAYVLSFALPGVDKKDVAIRLEENKLTVSSDTNTDDQKYRLREFNYGKFERVFNLPKNVDSTNITATYEAGILKLVLPIAEAAQPKSITVK